MRRALTRPLVAGLVLLGVYGALAFTLAPSGEVADVGGKLATLRVMDERGQRTPDVGYWAENLDPDGTLHPLAFTARVGDTWAQVTTLPMLYAAIPLWEVGGARLVVLLPMLGGLACALAARVLARRLGSRHEWAAFWAIGLATPVLVYSLSFWEHTIGLALMLWAVIVLFDVVERRSVRCAGPVAGALFGLAATMRTEALVYAATTVGVVVVVLAFARAWRAVVLTAAGFALGFVVVLGANQLFERAVLGAGSRSARVAGIAGGAGNGVHNRLDLAATTATALNGFSASFDWIVGAVALGVFCLGVWLLRSPARRLTGAVLVALAALVYLLVAHGGAWWIPGLLSASPLAALGLVFTWRRSSTRLLGVLALAPVPLVWASQFSGTMRPQWGGRYLFVSGALLAIVAIVELVGSTIAWHVALAAAVLVTAWGVAFVAYRSHDIADGSEQVLAVSDAAVVSLDLHFFREHGAAFNPSARWLSAESTVELRKAAKVFAGAGDDRFTVVAPAGSRLPSTLHGYRRVSGVLIARDIRPYEGIEAVRYTAG